LRNSEINARPGHRPAYGSEPVLKQS